MRRTTFRIFGTGLLLAVLGAATPAGLLAETRAERQAERQARVAANQAARQAEGWRQARAARQAERRERVAANRAARQAEGWRQARAERQAERQASRAERLERKAARIAAKNDGAAPSRDLTIRRINMMHHHNRPQFASGHILVRFDPAIPSWQRVQLADSIGASGSRTSVRSNYTRLAVAEGDTAEGLLARASGMGGILWAELDPMVYPSTMAVAAADVSPSLLPPVTFNDTWAPEQWQLDRVNLQQALAYNVGRGGGVVVAVIDTGVSVGPGNFFPNFTMPDMDRMRTVAGWDFWDNDSEPWDEGAATSDDEDSLRFGHGTFVASMILAQTNNDFAMASVAQNAILMPLRALGPFGGFSSDIADAIHFAVDNGADVINMSLGGGSPSGVMQEAVRRAAGAGLLIFAAAGNSGDEPGFSGGTDYPAAYDEVVAVGSTDFDDNRADYSNYGPEVEISAPVGDFGPTGSPDLVDASLGLSFLYDPVAGEASLGGFFSVGTSMAAPQAAASAALLLANGFPPAAIREVLRMSARDVESAGFDEDTGWGVIDLLAAHLGLGFGF